MFLAKSQRPQLPKVALICCKPKARNAAARVGAVQVGAQGIIAGAAEWHVSQSQAVKAGASKPTTLRYMQMSRNQSSATPFSQPESKKFVAFWLQVCGTPGVMIPAPKTIPQKIGKATAIGMLFHSPLTLERLWDHPPCLHFARSESESCHEPISTSHAFKKMDIQSSRDL